MIRSLFNLTKSYPLVFIAFEYSNNYFQSSIKEHFDHLLNYCISLNLENTKIKLKIKHELGMKFQNTFRIYFNSMLISGKHFLNNFYEV